MGSNNPRNHLRQHIHAKYCLSIALALVARSTPVRLRRCRGAFQQDLPGAAHRLGFQILPFRPLSLVVACLLGFGGKLPENIKENVEPFAAHVPCPLRMQTAQTREDRLGDLPALRAEVD